MRLSKADLGRSAAQWFIEVTRQAYPSVTNQELCHWLGLESQSHLVNWAKGRRPIPEKYVAKLVTLLCVTAEGRKKLMRSLRTHRRPQVIVNALTSFLSSSILTQKFLGGDAGALYKVSISMNDIVGAMWSGKHDPETNNDRPAPDTIERKIAVTAGIVGMGLVPGFQSIAGGIIGAGLASLALKKVMEAQAIEEVKNAITEIVILSVTNFVVVDEPLRKKKVVDYDVP